MSADGFKFLNCLVEEKLKYFAYFYEKTTSSKGCFDAHQNYCSGFPSLRFLLGSQPPVGCSKIPAPEPAVYQ